MVNYCYFERGKLTGPVNMRSRFKGVGGWHLLDDNERAEYGWYPCSVINEGFDPVTQTRTTLPELVFDESRKLGIATYHITEKSIDTVKAEQKERVTNSRYESEVSGIILDGRVIETDRTSQTRIAQAHALVSIDPTTKIDWKVGYEWIVLDASAITAMALAIGKHVQECFSKEMRLHKQIDEAETIDDVLKINW